MTTQHSSPTPGTSVPDALQSMAQSLAAPFRKDAAEEFFLDDLNQRLAAAHDQELVERPELFPTLHVVGPPRSGTTLLMQLLAAHLEVGYINNLIAAFGGRRSTASGSPGNSVHNRPTRGSFPGTGGPMQSPNLTSSVTSGRNCWVTPIWPSRWPDTRRPLTGNGSGCC